MSWTGSIRHSRRKCSMHQKTARLNCTSISSAYLGLSQNDGERSGQTIGAQRYPGQDLNTFQTHRLQIKNSAKNTIAGK